MPTYASNIFSCGIGRTQERFREGKWALKRFRSAPEFRQCATVCGPFLAHTGGSAGVSGVHQIGLR